MQLSSLGFLIFMAVGLCFYYILPQKNQWKVLFIMNIIFYCSFGLSTVGYIVLASLVTFFAARYIESRKRGDSKKKRILQCALILDFGLLAFVKYTDFLIININKIFTLGKIGYAIPGMKILVPIGISFYTFQIVGYLLDVYWGKEKAENNFARFFLFASFFPQIMQGPISKHKQLANQFTTLHAFEEKNIGTGILLVLWGFFKKLVIADTAAVAVNYVFQDVQKAYGINVIVAILCYCIQLYCDFSGGIDVIRGCSEMFGIELVENFKRPFFSKSIAEFWRRWHITLGIWMKDYIFYPLSLSKGMNKLGKITKNCFGFQIGRKIPVCLANIVVFLLVGIWHGPNWQFIFYGLYNGLIIAISSLLVPFYDKLYKITGISQKSRGMHLFQIFRTFILVNIGWYFDRSSSLSDAFTLMRNTIKQSELMIQNSMYLGLLKYQYAYMLIGCFLLFIVGIIEERGYCIRRELYKKPCMLRYAVGLALLFAIPMFSYYSPYADMAGGFMYANF